MTRFIPAEPFPPGEYLQDELDAREWTQDDLSEITGISRRQVINIVQGKSGITVDSAQAIGAAFDQDPITWMNLQVAFELATAAKEQRDVKKRARLFELVPIRELRRRGWIPESDETDRMEEGVCKLLNISTLEETPKLSVAARKASSYEFNNCAQLSWYFRVRQLGPLAPAPGKYKASDWEGGVEELLKLSANPEDIRNAPKVLGEMGVRLVLVEHLKQSKIDGVALWLDSTSPVVGLSLRYDRMDNFWFSLLHELVHIKHKDASPVDCDLGMGDGDLPKIEKRANQQAAEALVDTKSLDSFILRCGPTFYETRVVQFARSIGVHPSIVVGQLQHRKELKFSQMTKLRAKTADIIKGQALTDGWGNAVTVE